MKTYYIVDKLQTALDNKLLFSEWGARPFREDAAPTDLNEPVYIWARFRDNGGLHTWEATAGVQSLPDPLDNDELEDHHMDQLAPVLDLTIVALDSSGAVVAVDEATLSTLSTQEDTATLDSDPTLSPVSLSAAPSGPVKKRYQNGDGTLLSKKHSTRQVAKHIATTRDRDFRFHLFGI